MAKKDRPRLNQGRMQEKQNRMNQRGSYGRLQDGKNIIRVFTFNHVVTENDYDNGIYKKGAPHAPKVGEEVVEIDRLTLVHFTDDGVSNCAGSRKCSICKEAAELATGKSKAEKKAAQQLRARKQYNVNAVDMTSPENGMQVFSLPQTVYNDIITFFNSGEVEENELFGAKGRDIVINRNTKLTPDKMYKVLVRDASKCEELESDLQDQVKDLFEMETLDAGHVRTSKGGKDDDEEEEEEEEEKPARSRKSKRNNKKDEEDEEEEESEEEEEDEEEESEEEEDEEEEEEEEEKPARSSKKSSKKSKHGKKDDDDEEKEEEEEEEEEEGEEEEEEEKPARSSKKKKFKVSDRVKFKTDEGKELKGKITGIEGDFYVIKDTNGEEWEMEEADISKV